MIMYDILQNMTSYLLPPNLSIIFPANNPPMATPKIEPSISCSVLLYKSLKSYYCSGLLESIEFAPS